MGEMRGNPRNKNRGADGNSDYRVSGGHESGGYENRGFGGNTGGDSVTVDIGSRIAGM